MLVCSVSLRAGPPKFLDNFVVSDFPMMGFYSKSISPMNLPPSNSFPNDLSPFSDPAYHPLRCAFQPFRSLPDCFRLSLRSSVASPHRVHELRYQIFKGLYHQTSNYICDSCHTKRSDFHTSKNSKPQPKVTNVTAK